MPCKFIAMNCFVTFMSRFDMYNYVLSSGLFLSLKKLDIEFPNLFLIIQNLSTGSLNPTKKLSTVAYKTILSVLALAIIAYTFLN